MAFHPYPQLIRQVFNLSRFGLSRPVRDASPWPWVAHLASGQHQRTKIALFRLAFAAASPTGLTLRVNVTRWLIMQKARSHPSYRRSRMSRAPTACKHTVSGSISLAVQASFSPFPHGTSPLSVTREYLVLEGGPPSFPQGSTGPVVLGNAIQGWTHISATGLSPSMGGLSSPFAYISHITSATLSRRPITPRNTV